MIRLKSGKVVNLNENFDQFFHELQSEIISQSVETAHTMCDSKNDREKYQSVLLKEIMDNSIYVTHQIFELAAINKNMSKFLVTGFLFNSIVLAMPDLSEKDQKDLPPVDDHTLH